MLISLMHMIHRSSAVFHNLPIIGILLSGVSSFSFKTRNGAAILTYRTLSSRGIFSDDDSNPINFGQKRIKSQENEIINHKIRVNEKDYSHNRRDVQNDQNDRRGGGRSKGSGSGGESGFEFRSRYSNQGGSSFRRGGGSDSQRRKGGGGELRSSYSNQGGSSFLHGKGRKNDKKGKWNKSDGRELDYVRRVRSEPFEERRNRNMGLDYLYGVSPVLNALISKKRSSFGELLLQDRSSSTSSSKALSQEISRITKIAEDLDISVDYLSKHDLNMLCDNRPHQGVILAAEPIVLTEMSSLSPPCLHQMKDKTTKRILGPESIDDDDDLLLRENEPILSGEKAHQNMSPVWLALDEVMDPQNLGALLRSATFLGASGVVVCSKNSAALSPTVSKASSGALELVPMYTTSNMPKFLSESAENGWNVVGTTMAGQGIPLKELKNKMPTIVVLGNEGHGLRFLVEKSCSLLVNIPSSPTTSTPQPVNEAYSSHSGVSSLNVAVSGGIVLYHLLSS